MKIGDLVKNLNSEMGMLGIIVDWHDNNPVVQWSDGRCNWITLNRTEVI